MKPLSSEDVGRLVDGDPPPQWDPGEGLQHYLPDEAYFIGEGYKSRDWFNQAVRAVVECVMPLADRYEAAPLPASSSGPVPEDRMERRGKVPRDPVRRASFSRELLDWLQQPEGTLRQATLNLYRGERRLLVRSLGLPGVLTCTSAEFELVRSCWEKRGFPLDLYYPASEQRVVVDPLPYLGSVILKARRLGPIRWRNRQVREIEALRAQLPTEKRRHERFVDACDQFGSALLLRIAELEEPGKNSDQAHILALRKLYLDMRRCAKADPSE